MVLYHITLESLHASTEVEHEKKTKTKKTVKMCEIQGNTITENPPDEHTRDLVHY